MLRSSNAPRPLGPFAPRRFSCNPRAVKNALPLFPADPEWPAVPRRLIRHNSSPHRQQTSEDFLSFPPPLPGVPLFLFWKVQARMKVSLFSFPFRETSTSARTSFRRDVPLPGVRLRFRLRLSPSRLPLWLLPPPHRHQLSLLLLRLQLLPPC